MVVKKKTTIKTQAKTTKKTAVKKAAVKKTAVKKMAAKPAEKKASLANMKPGALNSLIAMKAYELFESHGYSHGNDLNDWYRAEKLVASAAKLKPGRKK